PPQSRGIAGLPVRKDGLAPTHYRFQRLITFANRPGGTPSRAFQDNRRIDMFGFTWNDPPEMTPRRTLVRRAILLSLLAGVLAVPFSNSWSVSWAQEYPSRTVRMIVPLGAGGPTDIAARFIAQGLSTQLEGSFVVENRPGASGVIGTDAVAKSAPDGY